MCIIQITIFALVFLSIPNAWSDEKMTTGGNCEYEKHKGVAQIISITSLKKSKRQSKDQYAVNFSFTPEMITKDVLQHTEGKRFVLLLKNSTYPGEKFLDRYNIKVGNTFESHMYLIVKGTCAPRYFEFPTIKLDDYL